MSIEVELDIFSGRHNPAWQLSEEELKEIIERLPREHIITERKITPSLVYRGFYIKDYNGSDEEPTLPNHIFNSVLTYKTALGEDSYYGDDRNLEELLIEQARRHGYSDIVDEIL